MCCGVCEFVISRICYYTSNKGVGEGAAGACAPALSKVGGHKSVFAPPPPLDRPSYLMSLFSHIL